MERNRAWQYDPGALTALLDLHRNRLYAYLYRMVGERAAVEDLFQATWLRVIENIDRYDERNPFEAWLIAIARNLAIDHLRRRKPESLDERLEERPASEPAARGPNALEQCMEHEHAAAVWNAVAEISQPYREVLALRFEQEMKLEEIAAVVRAPLSTVKSRLRRGLEALRVKLAPARGASG